MDNSDRALVSNPDDPSTLEGPHLIIHTWSGSGPDYVHVHDGDDEAWHVLEGTLTFRLGKDTFHAGPGTTVLAPAGTPHTYYEEAGPTKYLIFLTPRLDALIAELHRTPYPKHGEMLAQYQSRIVTP